jgi:hypothetical protein
MNGSAGKLHGSGRSSDSFFLIVARYVVQPCGSGTNGVRLTIIQNRTLTPTILIRCVHPSLASTQ